MAPAEYRLELSDKDSTVVDGAPEMNKINTNQNDLVDLT